MWRRLYHQEGWSSSNHGCHMAADHKSLIFLFFYRAIESIKSLQKRQHFPSMKPDQLLYFTSVKSAFGRFYQQFKTKIFTNLLNFILTFEKSLTIKFISLWKHCPPFEGPSKKNSLKHLWAQRWSIKTINSLWSKANDLRVGLFGTKKDK